MKNSNEKHGSLLGLKENSEGTSRRKIVQWKEHRARRQETYFLISDLPLRIGLLLLPSNGKI